MPIEFLEESEQFCHKDTDVYPDNENSVLVFMDMLTQWRVGGMGGAVGLDYNVFPIIFKIRNIDEHEQPEVFDNVRIMERAALIAMRSRE